MKKQLAVSFLSLCMAATLLPMGAFAAETDKAILPGTSGISGYDSQNSYDCLYYGQWEDAPIQWRVLDDQTNTGEEGLFVLSEGCLGTGNWGNIPFDDTNPKSNAWQGSDAQAWCNTLYTDHFTAGEQGAVLATTKSDDAYDSTSTAFPPSFVAIENILNGDKVFFLSAQEAETAAYGFTDDASRVARYQNVRNGLWWLRSPLVGLAADSAGYINGGGFTYYQWVASDNMARPAFNLDTDSVLFTSAAVGSKVSQGTISPIAAYTGNQWKLTLLDDTRSSFTAKQGDTITAEPDSRGQRHFRGPVRPGSHHPSGGHQHHLLHRPGCGFRLLPHHPGHPGGQSHRPGRCAPGRRGLPELHPRQRDLAGSEGG